MELTSISKNIINGLIRPDTPSLFRTPMTSVDCSQVSNVETLTSMDLINSMIYARHRILHDKCVVKASPAGGNLGLAWQNILADGSVPYICPQGLTGCYYGHCAFTNETECAKYSKLPYDSAGAMIDDNANNFYTEWRQRQGAATGVGGCYLGNYAFRRWCEIPSTRDTDKPDNDPKDALKYNPSDGTCELTQAYCDNKNMSWDSSSKTCSRSDGQKFFEALFGKTLDGYFSGNCTKLSDRRLKERLVKIGPDYGAPGVHLYLFFYSQEALKMYPGYKNMQIGFMADEIETIYPEIIEIKKGYKHISFTAEQLKERKYWRIINTLKHEHTILNTIMERYMLRPAQSTPS